MSNHPRRAGRAAVLLAVVLGCGDPAPTRQSSSSGAAAAPSAVAPSAPEASAAPSASAAAPAVDAWLERTLRAGDPRWEGWLARAEELRLQILVTIVEPRGAWQVHALRADREYFYPASAIKTFLAVAALRVLSRESGGDVPLGSRIIRCADAKPGCEPPKEDEDKEERTEEGRAKHDKLRVGEEIGKMLSYSDNDSYNRLYDIVGHRELNDEMRALGFSSVRFHHRMSAPAERSRATPRVIVRPPGKRELVFARRTSTLDPEPTPVPGLDIGTSYRDGRGIVDGPMSFATKNYASLRDLQRLNVSLLYPGRPEGVDLGLSDAQREHLVKSMTTSFSNKKRAAEHSPLSPGVIEIMGDDRVRYVGKSGRAYGFHLENALIEDKTTGRAFFVTATVYANPNGVMNDDDYGYDETTRPLLASLGAALSRAVFEPGSPDAASP